MLNNLAKLYSKQGRNLEAEALYKHALEILEKTLDPEHPEVRAIRHNLEHLRREGQTPPVH